LFKDASGKFFVKISSVVLDYELSECTPPPQGKSLLRLCLGAIHKCSFLFVYVRSGAK